MSKDGAHALNIPEWDLQLRTAFSTAGLDQFLTKYTAIEAPNDALAGLTIANSVKALLTVMLMDKRFEVFEGSTGSVKTNVKTEEKGETSPPQASSKASSSSSFLNLASPRRTGKVHQPQMDNVQVRLKKLVDERAAEMEAELKREYASAERRGAKRESVFLEYLTSVGEHERSKNRNAKVHVVLETPMGEKICSLRQNTLIRGCKGCLHGA